MIDLLLIIFGKAITKLFRGFKIGDGSTWPGHLALKINKNFVKDVLNRSKVKVIIVAGTNGKTTTSAMIKHALKKNGIKAFQNKSGANLINGVASSLIMHAAADGNLSHDFAIFEIDENALPQVINQTNPDFIVLLNLFRDQLDRYGEIGSIVSKWKKSINDLTDKTTLILNADDPQIAFLAQKTMAKTQFFGLNESNNIDIIQSAKDSDYCPNCGEKLKYKKIIFSHLGNWHCSNCGLKRPNIDYDKSSSYSLLGTYNKYNTHATSLLLKNLGLNQTDINKSLVDLKPSFGRQETIKYKDKNIQIFLSKNPTSFNESFTTITDLGAKTILIILNDRVPDGRDISWIWDTELINIDKYQNILIGGDRVYDMALRIKYQIENRSYDSKVKTFEKLSEAINSGIELITENETFYILPTYSAMLEVRKIITGKKIL